MGRITINGTQAGFSCKKEVSLALWDVKTNRAKGKSEEARTLNQEPLTISRRKSPGTTSTSATTTVLLQPRKSITAMSASQRNATPL